MAQQRIQEAYTYSLSERIFDKVPSLATRPKNRLLSTNRQIKSAKLTQNSPKTRRFAGIEPHCYIMATMGLKLSVYVNIYATECLFLRQKDCSEAARKTRES